MADPNILLPSSSPFPTPPPPPPAPLAPATNSAPNPTPAAASSSTGAPEHLMHKNRLQQFVQRASMRLPLYQTVNEGPPHDPQFRSTVLVEGERFVSPNFFSNRKAAEQDVAKIALQSLLEKMKKHGCSLVREETVFCKSILNELATKINLPIPSYNTVQSNGLIPTFVSSLVFDCRSYTGETGKTKKEAEQLAAQAAILSLMGNPDVSKILCEIIKSKNKLYAELNKVKDTSNVSCSTASLGIENAHAVVVANTPKESEAFATLNNVATNITQTTSRLEVLHHVFKKPKVEESSVSENLPIPFVLLSSGKFEVGSSSSKKQKKKKKKAKKGLQAQAQLLDSSLNVNQPSPCPVAQLPNTSMNLIQASPC